MISRARARAHVAYTMWILHEHFVLSCTMHIFLLFLFQLDRQNKKIAELEDTIRKLESLKTISENQNVELVSRNF